MVLVCHSKLNLKLATLAKLNKQYQWNFARIFIRNFVTILESFLTEYSILCHFLANASKLSLTSLYDFPDIETYSYHIFVLYSLAFWHFTRSLKGNLINYPSAVFRSQI